MADLRSWCNGVSVALFVLAPVIARGEKPEQKITVLEMDAVTVTATKTPRAIRDTPASVTVIDDKEMERRLTGDIKDLIRYEPGISVGAKPDRQGNTSFNIRGIEGNRVLILIDGVRVPDGPAAGLSFNRDLVDLDAVKSVEIIRGPASSLYGSDAIGGVVSYITKDPADYLEPGGRPWFAAVKGAYYSASRQWAETLTLAGRQGRFDGMLVYTRRDRKETANKGNIAPNPQDTGSDNLLAKLLFYANERHLFKLTAEGLDRGTRTDVRSAQGPVPGGSRIAGQRADDATRRVRLSLDHEYENPAAALPKIVWRLFWQDADMREHTEESRIAPGPAPNRLRVTDQDFLQTIRGGSLQSEHAFSTAAATHRLIYGLDLSATSTSRPRDRTEYNLSAGTSTKRVAGETFPNKTFPDTETQRAGFYMQDEIMVGTGRLTLIPGVRYDHYRMTPDPDQAFANINTSGYAVKRVEDSAVSPKLGAVMKLTPRLSAYAQYAGGFRSPPYDDANIAFTNFTFGYTVLPNPGLASEKSQNVELGLRGAFQSGGFSLAVFDNRYRDFIETASLGRDPATNLLVFQPRNLSKARIYGAEAKGEIRLGESLSLLGSLAYARGDNQQAGVPLDSVDPLKGVIGMRWQAPADRWRGELMITHMARKDRVSDPAFFTAPAHTTVDLLGSYNFSKRLRLNAGLFNLLDEKYWLWPVVRGRTASDPALDRYTQPGINVSASLAYAF
ncbi:MAG: TonB-dependent hemoglobin/transferrin/lactoferrin family receptor [Gammaproteobacteria bacterium]|nr:TonB-dependent hemoglobin/transferrin/lactoferrin family receptor [Gammaproteobacteria bacterium]